MKMANPGYIEETNEYLALRHYLIKRMGMDEVKGENLCFEIEMECKMSNENAPDILSLFDKYNVELNDNNAKKVIGLVQAVNLNTRKAVNRGYTDLQIEEINNRYMVQNDFPVLYVKNKSSRTYMFGSFFILLSAEPLVL